MDEGVQVMGLHEPTADFGRLDLPLADELAHALFGQPQRPGHLADRHPLPAGSPVGVKKWRRAHEPFASFCTIWHGDDVFRILEQKKSPSILTKEGLCSPPGPAAPLPTTNRWRAGSFACPLHA